MQMTYTTNRLLLCILHPNDAEKVLLFYQNNKDHFEPWEPARDPNFYTSSYHRLTLSLEYNLIHQSKLLRFWIFEKNDPNTIVGTINFYNIINGPHSCCQLGYKLDSKYIGKGYAYESIQIGLQILFEAYKIHRIEANIMPTNLPSLHLIEKLGFEYEGVAKSNILINHKWEDHLRYALITDK